MALQSFSTDVSVHNTMADQPPFTADEIKDIFDTAPNLIKTWINDVLVLYINENMQTKISYGTEEPPLLDIGEIYIRY